MSAIKNKIHSAPAVAAFMSIGLFQGVTVTLLMSVVLVQWEEYARPTVIQVPRGYSIPTNFAIFIFGFIFHLIFMWDAIRLRSTAQAVLACVVNAGFLPLAIFQRQEIKEGINSLKGSTDRNGDALVNTDMDIWPLIGKVLLIIPIIIAACTLVLPISAWYLKQYFSWQSYRNVGADAKLRKIRIIHQIFVMLAKMDIYFCVCFELIFSFSVLGGPVNGGVYFIINLVLLGVALIIICMSIVFSKSENRIGMCICIVMYLAMFGYWLYLVIDVHLDSLRRHSGSINSFTAFGCMGILSSFMAAIFAILCFRNFFGGLKEHLGKHEEAWDPHGSAKDFELHNDINFGYKGVPAVRDLDS
ncbi:UPF0658 golgi apparatus membrane [Fusarium beomiforme]|uniref:UPF0658 golgi apparatus membrane n=1 Tax=Fusarium beomiforme TaxID=44412 RepID=A0A9P5AIZ1_9HYPO|nr:UPF0658 golgi apparatus membrane [Fusarium beomiforme]